MLSGKAVRKSLAEMRVIDQYELFFSRNLPPLLKVVA